MRLLRKSVKDGNIGETLSPPNIEGQRVLLIPSRDENEREIVKIVCEQSQTVKPRRLAARVTGVP